MSRIDECDSEQLFWRGAIVVGILVVPIALTGIIWYARANDHAMETVFSPREESVRRKTFEESRAYNQGMIQELQNMQFEYIKASPEQQVALRSIILHRAADYDVEKMPPDLRSFIMKLRSEQGKSEIRK